MNPKVVAVIPTRNRQDKTVRFLECFSQQTYSNLHTVVVDANSTDGTQDVIHRRFPNIPLVHVDDESYWTASTNRGVEFALEQQADFILTINDDSYILDDYVEKLVAIAQKHQVSILGSRIDYLVRPGLVWSLGAYSTWGTRDIFQLSQHNVWEDNIPKAIKENDITEVDALAGNGVLIHRSVFEKIGLYNERFLPHYHADSEIIMRAVKQGIKAFTTNSVIVYNDCPEPVPAVQQSDIPASYPPISDLLFIFFHKKSHLYTLPSTYVIAKYCPWDKKLSTFYQVVVYPILSFLVKNYLKVSKGKIKKIVKKVAKLTIHRVNWLFTPR